MTHENQDETIQIKKYGNRRFYSSAETRFVTLDEIAALVQSGKKVRVTDADSDDDITSEILTQILLENGRAQHFPVEVLEQMIRLNEKAVSGLWSSYFENSLKMMDAFQKSFQALRSGNPFFDWASAVRPATGTRGSSEERREPVSPKKRRPAARKSSN